MSSDGNGGTERPKITAIEGIYRGRWYRSRLECRWAFLFDELGIDYRYEPEGYRLSDGRKYLPDFYLPEIDGFAEVKPTNEKLSEQMWAITDFIKAGMGNKILLLIDEPSFKPYMMIRPVHLAGGFVESNMTNALLDVYYRPKLLKEERRLFEDVPDYNFEKEEDFTIEYRQAVYMARAARFDHGQEGVPPKIREQIKHSIRLKAFGDIA